MQQMTMWIGTDSENMMSSLVPCTEGGQGASTNNNIPPLSSSSTLLQIPSSSTTGGLLDPRAVVTGTATSLAISSDDLLDGQEGSMPVSWSQLLLLGGLVGDHHEERYSAASTALLSKNGLIQEEEGPMPHAAATYNFYGGGGQYGGEEILTNSKSQAPASQTMLLASSPRSCVTTSLGSNMLDFSNNNSTAPAPAPELRNHQSDNSSESNSNPTGSAPKKARVQTSSSAQSTLKVRKERLGDRITALHQIVSPFGKTDTASVLQETIGYIRFLLGQIEALSYPYLGDDGAGNGDSMLQHQQQTLLNHSTTGGAGNGGATVDAGRRQAEQQQDAAEKDLRSRGLCLVPVSCCTSHLADDDNGASSDLWAAPAAAPVGGIIWR